MLPRARRSREPSLRGARLRRGLRFRERSAAKPPISKKWTENAGKWAKMGRFRLFLADFEGFLVDFRRNLAENEARKRFSFPGRDFLFRAEGLEIDRFWILFSGPKASRAKLLATRRGQGGLKSEALGRRPRPRRSLEKGVFRNGRHLFEHQKEAKEASKAKLLASGRRPRRSREQGQDMKPREASKAKL